MPGVYWFVGADDKVLYVGKAKNLKNRLAAYRQHFQLNNRLKQMVLEARELKHQPLDSELEALLIEAELIHTHQPPYNILLKDDKTPLYVVITHDVYPRVVTARKREVQKGLVKGTLFGPFPSSFKVREVLRIARPIFRWCQNPPLSTDKPQTRPCFYYHLQLCSGACVCTISPEEYAEDIRQLVLFLKGKKKEVVKTIEKKLHQAAASEEFETAAILRDRVAIIKTVTENSHTLRPDAVLPTLKVNQAEDSLVQLRHLLSTYAQLPSTFSIDRIEGYDVSNTQGTNAAVAMVTFTGGAANKQEYRLFNIKTVHQPNDYAMLQEALQRRQNHPEWGEPDVVVIDGGKGQLRAAVSVWHWSNPIISIAKKPDRIIIPQVTEIPAAVGDFTQLPTKKITGYHELKLAPEHPALKLIQQVRDESHRFSKKQHTGLRLKQLFT